MSHAIAMTAGFLTLSKELTRVACSIENIRFA
jgi:hypothetical protein